MEKRKLGNTDMQVTVLGFGGAEIGYEGATQSEVNQLLNSALDAGLNVIDTATGYVNSEELIGHAVSHRRKDYYLFTKCGLSTSPDRGVWSKPSVLANIEDSLRKLKTDYLDLVQLHSCAETFLRDGEPIEALQEAKRRGLTRYIGYSGDEDPARFAIECGAFDTLQTSISIADQRVLEGNLPLAVERNVGIIAKRPIANAAWRTGKKPENPYHHEYWDRLQVLQYDFLRRPLAEAVSIALRFTLTQPGVHTAIVGTKNPDRWKENAKLLEAGPLSRAEIDAIRARWKDVAKASWVGQI